ncbi:MFS transporter [Peribacillus simplex]|uniref:MFS transporter n=1 Tax=Peribacillus simplex TaxID=1478 RepID=UPI003D287C66
MKILQQIRSESIAQQELKEIKAYISKEKKIELMSFKDLRTPWIRRIVILGIFIGSISQLVGINSIMYYGTQILENSGFGTKTALIANVANGLIAVVAVIVGISTLMLNGSPMLPYVVLSMTVVYLAFFQGAIGPMVW